MLDQFPGYFRKSPQQIKAIWQKCVFALDANVLLNLYRYSPATARSSFDVLKKLQDRLWIPWQAAMEFHENRLVVIDKQTRTYQSTSDTASKLIKSLEHPREHPYVDEKLLEKLKICVSDIVTSLDTSRDNRRKLLTNDPMLNDISALVSDRIGIKVDEATRTKQIESATKRCERKIPPGFRDTGKDGVRQYGDVLMWFELMEYAKSTKIDIVFVTDDTKNDWWYEVSGIVIGPLPALVQEFSETTKQQLLLYRPDRFFEHAAEYLNRELAPSVVEEMREQTATRIRRNRKRLSNPEADYLHRLCQHLWSHKDEAAKLISAVGKLSSSEWRNIRNIIEIPSDIRNDIDSAISSCKCLRGLLSDITNITAPGYQDVVSEIEKHASGPAIQLLSAFRQVAEPAIEYVRISNRGYKES